MTLVLGAEVDAAIIDAFKRAIAWLARPKLV
jgi:hypothetical protein